MTNPEKTRKGERQIMSVSIPVAIYERLEALMQKQPYNRSAFVSMAIENMLESVESLEAQAEEMEG